MEKKNDDHIDCVQASNKSKQQQDLGIKILTAEQVKYADTLGPAVVEILSTLKRILELTMDNNKLLYRLLKGLA